MIDSAMPAPDDVRPERSASTGARQSKYIGGPLRHQLVISWRGSRATKYTDRRDGLSSDIESARTAAFMIGDAAQEYRRRG